MASKIAIVTGGKSSVGGLGLTFALANQGIGFEIARQLAQQGHTVYLGARNPERGYKAMYI